MLISAFGVTLRGAAILRLSSIVHFDRRYIDPILGSSVSNYGRGTPFFGIKGTSSTTAMKTL
jgi:hypothetical protein